MAHGNVSRRDFLAMTGCGILSLGALGLGLGAAPALANTGGSGGDETDPHGSGGVNVQPAGWAWQWFDEGGFYGTGDESIRRDPTQGWNENSREWFWKNKVCAYMKEISDTPGLTPSNHAYESYLIAANDALESARARERAMARQGNYPFSEKARVVAAGWSFAVSPANRPHSTWNVVDGWTGNLYSRLLRTYATSETFTTKPNDKLRFGNAMSEGLASTVTKNGETYKTGWDTKIGKDAFQAFVAEGYHPDANETDLGWRKYIYQLGMVTLTKHYSIVVLAVADGWPRVPSGFMRISKKLTF